MTRTDLLAAVTEATARQLSHELEEPDWLLDERLDAVGLVTDLPDESNTLWTTYLDLRPVRFGDVALAVVRDGGLVPAAAEAAPLPDGAAGLIHVADGRVVGRVRSRQAAEAGLFMGTFNEALRDARLAPILRAAIADGRSLAADDRFGQVSRAIASIGVLVHVPDGVELQGPVVVRWSVAEPGRALVTRTVVVLGERARAGLLEELDGPAAADRDAAASGPVDADAGAPPAQRQWWGTCEVILGDGSALDVAGLQDFDSTTVGFVSRTATAGRDAALNWAMAHVGGLWSKSRIDNHLLGQGSSVHQAEIAFGGASQVFDLSSYTHHVGTDTTGDLLSKGVFQDRARATIKGLIRIDRSAHGTDSYLGEFGMLLAKKARSVTIPSLEIDQPDVRRASHASSVAPIDESQVFYAMTRGLSQDEARKAITLAFLEPVVARIPLADVQERLRDRLEVKWVEAHGGTLEAPGAERVLTGSTAA